MFIHLFYWLSLVDLQDPSHAPLPMAAGVSIEFVIIAIVYNLVRYLSDKPDFSLVFVGAIGTVLVMFGFALIAGLNENKYVKAMTLNSSYLLDRRPFYHDNKAHSSVSKSAHFVALGEDNFNNTFSKLKLTKKELQVSYLMACGYKNSEIIKDLLITENTLKYHYKNIYSKLCVSNRSKAIEKLFNLINPGTGF